MLCFTVLSVVDILQLVTVTVKETTWRKHRAAVDGGGGSLTPFNIRLFGASTYLLHLPSCFANTESPFLGNWRLSRGKHTATKKNWAGLNGVTFSSSSSFPFRGPNTVLGAIDGPGTGMRLARLRLCADLQLLN
ncbi:hypothetical protein BaRGS_00007824 [Batillaria attramentaria]|uniref:Secreted protein n=1 Tax=Batillaria attramentaria TaxID=370345 RepID=A0ABD0LMV4_9CAEN